MPRIKSPPRKCFKSRNGHSKTWILMIECGLAQSIDAQAADLTKLRHPRSGHAAMFIFSPDRSTIQEVFSFSQTNRSWFIDDSVKEDGKMHFTTPVDPVFLVLPYLKKSKEEGKLVPLADLLLDADYPETSWLLSCCELSNMELVADCRGDAQLNAWMYNEEKTLKWLCRKTRKVSALLKEKQVQVTESAVSTNIVQPSREDSNGEIYLNYAHGLVAEYLPDDLSEKLRTALGLPAETVNDMKASPSDTSKRRSTSEVNCESAKKPKTEDAGTAKNLSSKDKARQRAASGSKPITSFFKKL